MPESRFWLALGLGLFAGLADYLGGFLLVRRSPSARMLRYFVALGAGFMLAAALLEMLPEAFANLHWAAALVLAGYCGVHLLEHTLVPHFHFGEETHHHEFISKKSSYSVLLGLATHTFFDGDRDRLGICGVDVARLGAICSDFSAQDSRRLYRSERDAGGRTGTAGALNSALFLGAMTVLGVLAINLDPGWVKAGLPLSAGVTIYVAATDLVPRGKPGAGSKDGAGLLWRSAAVFSAADAGTGIDLHPRTVSITMAECCRAVPVELVAVPVTVSV